MACRQRRQAARPSSIRSIESSKSFQYDVTLGDWSAVKSFLAKLPKDEGKAAYEQLIQTLGNPDGDARQPADANANAADANADADEYGDALRRGLPKAPPPPAVHDGEKRLLESGYLRSGRAAPHGLDDGG